MESLIDMLPAHLRERTTALNGRPPRADAAFVLYWMHHAARGHENPALDAALMIGARLGLPVLVYQGLGGGHRHDSDRHHRFILEGARDAQAELRARGIRHVFSLPTDPPARTPLHALVARAAVLVCEDFPAPPFPRWTQSWADRAPCAALAVDAACLVPQRSLARRPERAFAFRDAVRKRWRDWLDAAWPDAPVGEGGWFDGDAGFAPFDLDGDLDAAIAGCAIDHGVGPVAHTPGGSRAGYARWETFKREGLAAYARLRNDAAIAWPHGVSRMSPYLHHGMVSPFRIAREAQAAGGPGAEKFLDELLVWRELAFHWCAHTRDPETLAALPGWARETLAAHARDPRAPAIDPGRLERSASGSALWDAAQDSLRRHGELHNNLRMTWGKAIVGWTAGPEEALRTLVDLNHRYALDGNDPASYGGLLWCLGLFDRPFAPEQTVLGTLRPRDPDSHATRLDLAAYRRIVDRPAGRRRLRVAVVGAGMAGATAARVLLDQGHAVQVFEKSRGAGGRMATRRDEGGAWDFGAPAFDAVDPRFRRQLADWLRRGIVARHDGARGTLADGRFAPSSDAPAAFVGAPGMNALARDLIDGIALESGVRIAALRRDGSGWVLLDEDGAARGEADTVLVAVPPAQAAPLVADSAALHALASAAEMAPCWAVRLRCALPPALPFAAARIEDPVLAWCGGDAGHPGRAGRGTHWVVQATAAWSDAHLEESPETVAPVLIDAWRRALGPPGEGLVVEHADAHRWRYARPSAAAGPGFAFDGLLGLALAGDWLRGPRVEDAWLSGVAAAGALLRAAARS
jgi:hypothetical protein